MQALGIHWGPLARTLVILNLSPVRAAGANPVARGRGLWAAGLLSVGAILGASVSGCATSVVYVSSTAQGIFFKLPQGWHVFGQNQLKRAGFVLDVNATNRADQTALGNSYPVFYSLSSPSRRVATRFGIQFDSKLPWALAVVISLGYNSQSTITLAQLTDQFFNVDGLAAAGGKAIALRHPSEVVSGPYRGMRIAYRVDQPVGRPFDFEQVAVLNSATTKLWMLDLGCSPSCFEHNRRAMDFIAGSFTVKQARP